MKITITIEPDRPFNGNELTLEDFERDRARRNRRNRTDEEEEDAPNWLVRMEELRRQHSII